MDPSPDETRRLLAAWALNALGTAEQTFIDDAVLRDSELRVEAETLKRVSAALAEPLSVSPPASLRNAVLTAALERPRDQPMAAAIDGFAAARLSLAGVLSSLDTAAWHALARPYEWTAHGLVAHLAVVERYMAAQVGIAGSADLVVDGDTADHLGMGAAMIERELRRNPHDTMQSWLTASALVLDHLAANPTEMTRELMFNGWPMRIDTLLIVRTFELWTHENDICAAVGYDLGSPSAPVLRTMSSASVLALPVLLPLVSRELEMVPTRMVLTGDGGGTYDVGPAGARELSIVADVVDYCRFVARRLAVEQLAPAIEGDAQLALALLESATLVSV